MTVRAMCETAAVSRAGFYRHCNRPKPGTRNMDLRNEILKIALEWPAYGRRRITQELRDRGWKVNGKRVRRIMREDNLLCLRRRKYVVTTDSNHNLPVYPNLAGEMTLTGINQLWVADITYIRLEEEFVYLAVVLDAYSRRVIGWALDRTMETALPLAALRMALAQRRLSGEPVHHSDQGSVYASHAYTGLLKQHGVTISMSFFQHPDFLALRHFVDIKRLRSYILKLPSNAILLLAGQECRRSRAVTAESHGRLCCGPHNNHP
jgi:putative transposase